MAVWLRASVANLFKHASSFSLLLLTQGHVDAQPGFSVHSLMPGPYMQWALVSCIVPLFRWPFSRQGH